MDNIDKLIHNYKEKLTEIVTKMNQLERAGDILTDKIDNINNLVDDNGEDYTSVADIDLAEKRKEELLNDIETVATKYIELQDNKTKLINQLRSLATRIDTRRSTGRGIGRGKKKNKTSKKRRNKKNYK
jgi:chromosome segregation ATPase